MAGHGRLTVTQEMVDLFKAEWERHDRLHSPDTRLPGDRTRAGLEAVLDLVEPAIREAYDEGYTDGRREAQ